MSVPAPDVLQPTARHGLVIEFESILARSPGIHLERAIRSLAARGLESVDVVYRILGVPTLIEMATQCGRLDVIEELRRYEFGSRYGIWGRDVQYDRRCRIIAAMTIAITCSNIDTGYQLVQQLFSVGVDTDLLTTNNVVGQSSLLQLSIEFNRMSIMRSLFRAGARTRVCGKRCINGHIRCAIPLIRLSCGIMPRLYIIAHLTRNKCIGMPSGTPSFLKVHDFPIHDVDRGCAIRMKHVLPIVAAAMLRLTHIVRHWLREVPIPERTLDQLEVAMNNTLVDDYDEIISDRIERTHELYQLYLSSRLLWSTQLHDIFPKNIRRTILVLLCVQNRIRCTRHLPVLPNEIWLHIFSFFSRSWGCTPVDEHFLPPPALRRYARV
jgi:hypothetical protein